MRKHWCGLHGNDNNGGNIGEMGPTIYAMPASEKLCFYFVRATVSGILVRMNYLKEKENHLCYLCGGFALLLTRVQTTKKNT